MSFEIIMYQTDDGLNLIISKTSIASDIAIYTENFQPNLLKFFHNRNYLFILWGICVNVENIRIKSILQEMRKCITL